MIRAKAEILKMSPKAVALGLLLAGLMAASMATRPTHADTTFTVTNTNDSGAGSLRQVIELANETPGADLVRFGIPEDPNIPGDEVKTIHPTSELPETTEAMTIDGYSQPGASPNTSKKGSNAQLKIQLDGTNAGNGANGLEIGAEDVVVKGLAIHGFSGSGVAVESGADGARIEGNFIGTGITGEVDQGNGLQGVSIDARSAATVGGASPDKRNIISGNSFTGVSIEARSPFSLRASKVEGNLIGTDKSGAADLGNGGFGVFVSSPGNTVGGNSSGAANTIAFNSNGVVIDRGSFASGNRISRNSIFSNDELGIDVGRNGSTPNDLGDVDEGGNKLQNTPTISSAKIKKGKTAIQGKLNSAASQTYEIQLYSNPEGEDEGRKFLGQTTVATNALGNAPFAFKLKGELAKGANVTATATDFEGNTSEFSDPRNVAAKQRE